MDGWRSLEMNSDRSETILEFLFRIPTVTKGVLHNIAALTFGGVSIKEIGVQV